MTGNRRLFTSYKAYDGGHVVFGSNLKGKVVGRGNNSHESITITNVEHVSGLAFNLDTLKHKAYICLNKENNEIKESLNVTFDESLPKPKSPPSVEDDRIDEPIVQDLNGSPSLQVNVSNESYPKSLKEAIVPKHQVDSHMGKISHELEEPIRSAHVDESVCCQVQHMMKESIYALRKEMRERQTLINNYLKVLTVFIEDIARVFLQDTNEE
ncbi:hypothetical protein Tco_0240848 [Tanacetum coccineum]